jgi:hypothetical protein
MDLGCFTAAKVEADFMDSVYIYDDEIIASSRLRVITLLPWIVSELDAQAKQLERDTHKKCATPLLRADEFPSLARINAR